MSPTFDCHELKEKFLPSELFCNTVLLSTFLRLLKSSEPVWWKYRIMARFCTSLPSSGVSDVTWYLEIGHGESMDTAGTDKRYKSVPSIGERAVNTQERQHAGHTHLDGGPRSLTHRCRGPQRHHTHALNTSGQTCGHTVSQIHMGRCWLLVRTPIETRTH